MRPRTYQSAEEAPDIPLDVQVKAWTLFYEIVDGAVSPQTDPEGLRLLREAVGSCVGRLVTDEQVIAAVEKTTPGTLDS